MWMWGCHQARPGAGGVPPPGTAVGSHDSEFHWKKNWGEKYFIKNHHFWKVSVTAEMKPFCSVQIFSFKLTQSTVCQNVLSIKGDVIRTMLCFPPPNNLYFECQFETYLFTPGTNTSTGECLILSRRLKSAAWLEGQSPATKPTKEK